MSSANATASSAHKTQGRLRPPPRIEVSDQESLRRALIELMRAAGLVRRIGTNINQAVAKLNATGQPAGNLPGYAAGTIHRADHIDEVADAVRKALG